jgi:glycosyltransferase involved in cell wall biosynthesis
MKLKIAIVVHGRFHAFDLARALVQRGHDVTLLTNYPKWAVKRFDFPAERICSFWQHGVLTRVLTKICEWGSLRYPEAWLHIMFGRWAATELLKGQWDVVYSWSGVTEEILGALEGKSVLRMMARGSSHINVQAKLLQEEEIRTGCRLDKPSAWRIGREKREYVKADCIVVLSSFCHSSFIEEGIAPQKLALMPTTARLSSFRPCQKTIEARKSRILSGQPLQVLFVGTVCYRKGLSDLITILKALNDGTKREKFQFRFIGSIAPEAKKIVGELKNATEFVSRRPQQELPEWYAQADLFIFPSIEEGLAGVIAQAAMSGLPILTTTNSGGAELIKDGETGWVLPIRNPEAFIERLRWCDEHREELAKMVCYSYETYRTRDWDDVAADFEAICLAHLAQLC